MDEIKKHEEMTVFEGEKLIEDHEYDGIHELDNSPPPWLLTIWWLGVAFAVAWLLYYHVFGGPSQEERYASSVAAAEAEMPGTGDVSIAADFFTDAASLEAGKAIWDVRCATCHLNDGGGLVGPNMTDDYWIYEPTMESMFNIIADGVQEKGMIPFKDVLTPQQIQEVASFIWSLQGSTPATPKAPEGEQYSQ